jgi:hypothetical protein
MKYSLLFYSLILSAILLLLGSIMLINRVPYILTLSSFILSFILIITSYFIYNRNIIAEFIGLFLSIILIISSSISQAHIKALLDINLYNFSNFLLVIIMVFAFYVFPIIYIAIFLIKYYKNKGLSKRV